MNQETTVEGRAQDAAAADSALSTATADARALVANVEGVIVGKRAVVEAAVCALLAGGHVLLEDVPGIGKTVLARALAQSIAAEFSRVQFTADLLPSDVTGVNIYRQDEGRFEFRPGPVFSNVLLGDEINRATPRTQSSLLEAMEEGHATVDGVRHELPTPFFVIATQNPIELEGTYPLPFAQMDRFLIRLSLGYLPPTQEREMLAARITADPIDSLPSVLDCNRLQELQAAVRQVTITEELLDYVVALVNATRTAEDLAYGASPRGSLDLMRFSQARALLAGRDYVLPDDIKGSAPVLSHRLIVQRGRRNRTVDTDDLVQQLVETVEVPT